MFSATYIILAPRKTNRPYDYLLDTELHTHAGASQTHDLIAVAYYIL